MSRAMSIGKVSTSCLESMRKAQHVIMGKPRYKLTPGGPMLLNRPLTCTEKELNRRYNHE